MCLILVNNIVNQQLDELEQSNDKSTIEKRLYEYAKIANKEQPGPLDLPKNRIKYMSEDLREVRKHRIGKHRVFYVGHHTQCSYTAFFIKKFKKSDKDQEGSTRFQNKLRRALDEPPTRNITK